MVGPSGEQYVVRGGGYRAVVTESGASLRVLEHEGRPLVLGWPEDAASASGRGQLLVPWPNRVRDGRYTFAGTERQLPLTEPARGNASHGLVRWVSWTPEEATASSVSLGYRLMSQPGYPWTLDLHVVYDLSAVGLTVTLTATNLSDAPAPYATGAHPYLVAGTGPVDGWELTAPASTELLVDEQLIPTGEREVAGTDRDFRVPRRIGDTSVDTAFTGLGRGPDDRVTVTLRDPVTDQGVELWADGTYGYLQLFTGDALPVHARASLAVEPMTAAPDAFNSGAGLLVLAPAGSPGDEVSASWGIHAL